MFTKYGKNSPYFQRVCGFWADRSQWGVIDDKEKDISQSIVVIDSGNKFHETLQNELSSPNEIYEMKKKMGLDIWRVYCGQFPFINTHHRMDNLEMIYNDPLREILKKAIEKARMGDVFAISYLAHACFIERVCKILVDLEVDEMFHKMLSKKREWKSEDESSIIENLRLWCIVFFTNFSFFECGARVIVSNKNLMKILYTMACFPFEKLYKKRREEGVHPPERSRYYLRRASCVLTCLFNIEHSIYNRIFYIENFLEGHRKYVGKALKPSELVEILGFLIGICLGNAQTRRRNQPIQYVDLSPIPFIINFRLSTKFSNEFLAKWSGKDIFFILMDALDELWQDEEFQRSSGRENYVVVQRFFRQEFLRLFCLCFTRFPGKRGFSRSKCYESVERYRSPKTVSFRKILRDRLNYYMIEESPKYHLQKIEDRSFDHTASILELYRKVSEFEVGDKQYMRKFLSDLSPFLRKLFRSHQDFYIYTSNQNDLFNVQFLSSNFIRYDASQQLKSTRKKMKNLFLSNYGKEYVRHVLESVFDELRKLTSEVRMYSLGSSQLQHLLEFRKKSLKKSDDSDMKLFQNLNMMDVIQYLKEYIRDVDTVFSRSEGEDCYFRDLVYLLFVVPKKYEKDLVIGIRSFVKFYPNRYRVFLEVNKMDPVEDLFSSCAEIRSTENEIEKSLSEEIPKKNILRVDKTQKKKKKSRKKKRCKFCRTLKEKMFKCSRCKSVHYCSRECQKKDWKNGHKETCLKIRN